MPEPTPSEPSAADREIAVIAERLQEMKTSLGSRYWQSEQVQSLQQRLRHLIGTYAAWAEDKLPMHQRARRAARLESQLAHLLWPGRDA